jgi:hypothetical protein
MIDGHLCGHAEGVMSGVGEALRNKVLEEIGQEQPAESRK